MKHLGENTKISAFLKRLKEEWPDQIERFDYKTTTLVYMFLKEGVSSFDFSETLSKRIGCLVDFTTPIVLYHVEHDGLSMRSQPLNWFKRPLAHSPIIQQNRRIH